MKVVSQMLDYDWLNGVICVSKSYFNAVNILHHKQNHGLIWINLESLHHYIYFIYFFMLEAVSPPKILAWFIIVPC